MGTTVRAEQGPLRVVAVYNRYLARGGEDDVFESDVALMLRHGWQVVPVTVRTEVPRSLTHRLGFAIDTIWSRAWYLRFRALLRLVRPHVVHVYNSFPRFSPSIFAACRREGVPVVLTVQNYRLGCPKATLYREGAICERCLERRFAWPGIRHGCYHGSAVQTAVVASSTAFHRLIGTWQRRIDLYLPASDFTRQKLIAAGLPADRIAIKPNFRHPDPGFGAHDGDFCLFVGRLSAEKGIPTLLAAAATLDREIAIKIVGDGPLLANAREAAASGHGARVEVLGRQPNTRVIELMRAARFLIFPSEWYEGLPMTLIEAFACGLPTLVGRVGAAAEAVGDGVEGCHATAGDAADLGAKITELWHAGVRRQAMAAAARATYEARYTADANMTLIRSLYQRVLDPPAPEATDDPSSA